MASKPAIVRSTDPTEPGMAAEEREGLVHSSREQEIRNRAYEIFLQRGRQAGYELEDWLQAERELATNYSDDAVLQPTVVLVATTHNSLE